MDNKQLMDWTKSQEGGYLTFDKQIYFFDDDGRLIDDTKLSPNQLKLLKAKNNLKE